MSNKRSKNAIVIAVAVLVIAGMLFSMLASSVGETMAMTLKKGARGEQVKKLQRALDEKGYYGEVDGVFGTWTEKKLKEFQSASGLIADGIAGKQTLQKLGIGGGASSGGNKEEVSNNTSYSDSDVYLLARTIHAEARGESYIGKVAVGAVILNRVKSPEFPNSISGVVYQPWAFTAVHDGQINLEPNEEAIRAAKDAINGWDPSYGCLFYYNPDKATSEWIFSTQTVTKIGDHIFSI